jgi:hypothetical protein
VEANRFGGFGVNDHPGGIRGHFGREVAALRYGPADRAAIVRGDVDVTEHDLVLIGGLARPVEAVAVVEIGEAHVGESNVGCKALVEK